MNETTLKHPARRAMLARAVAHSAALAAGSLLGSDALAAPSATADASARRPARSGRQTVDVLIVGGGSAGAVMAARLSEKASRNVLLLEAGRNYAAWDYPRVIASSDRVGGDAPHEWGYRTQVGYVDHPIGALRGKVLGGSSAINGAVAIRARPQDLKHWNLPGWSYADMLPSFKRLEHRDSGSAELHGHAGPLPVRQLTRDDVTPMQRAFIDAAVANGYRAVDDFDGPDANGVGPYPMNIVNGVRVNTGIAYLTNEVRARENLRIRGDALVDRVLFDGDRAIGVRLDSGEEIHANEVILSAGAYGSAAILLRSGIGPGADLRALSIPEVAALPVGQRLQDHPFYYNAYAARPDRIGDPSPVIGAFLWTNSSTAQEGDLDLHITATHLFPHDQSPTGVGFVLAVALTRPLSVGSLKLASRRPGDAPLIDLNFLADERDRARLLDGIRLSRRIGRTAPLSDLIHEELNPGPLALTDAQLLASARSTLDTYHHPTSTAPMGAINDPHAVVDLDARVHGVRNLRVVDASIFPEAISVATNITTIATAEHIAHRYI
ncbi:GMC family oxidoreductase [Burkholderia stagnalis]|uniref:Dehydrogenase n=1 Tax=Burkholderia stagnalis TaxID=1503054 RepID=A0A107ZZL5_9BURK|nr:GMC family oxidoreductase N-terminal domain-containing protein [Burkholderia stagnalis]KVZ02596.1 dehydrogenase [Burkholderia stagnalis]KWA53710.1 dehydrogenase [Burkholderia stagnalis]KWA58824.1 dehydrogenase [Burkholderia stagnalis]KWA60712.1 dehydrogenase [Burkholderia stagnalis]KWC97587.1 dehydrogenase [Burkholderia stagnalis]